MLPLIIGVLEDQSEEQVHTAEAKPLKTSSKAEETDLQEAAEISRSKTNKDI